MKAQPARPRIASRQRTGARARVFSRTGRRNSPSLMGLDLEGCDEPVELLENEGLTERWKLLCLNTTWHAPCNKT